MPASSGPEVRVPIAVPVDTNAREASASVQTLTDRIAASKDAIRDATANLRNLKGSDDAVKAAKDQLNAVLAREKKALSDATIQVMKQGQSAERLVAQQAKLKKANEEARKAQEASSRAVGDAVSRAGGPIAALRDRLKSLASLGGEGSSALSVLTFAAAGLTAAAVAAAAAVGGLLVGLAAWALRGADAARSMNLVREAAAGSSLNAKNLGTQIDALAGKVPTSTEALNELASSLAKSRLGGQTMVDTLNAVAQANAALGDSAGSAIRGIIERGRVTQRMFLGLQELQGTGIDFDDVASALARSMKVGINDARRALVEGRVSLADGAKAMREAMESKFGDINLRKMMSIGGLADTLKKKFAAMTKGIDLEPASRAVFKFLQVFDESTATGAVLQRAVTAFGNGVVKWIERGAPIAKEFIRGLIIGGLQIYISYLQVKKAFREAFGDVTLFENVDALKVALEAGRFAAVAFAGAIVLTGAVLATPIALAWGLAEAIDWVTGRFEALGKSIRESVLAIDWSKLGSNAVDGLIAGMNPMRFVEHVKSLAEKGANAFASAMGIRSPSTRFEKFGEQLDAGVAKGASSSTAGQRAIADMVAPPSTARAGGISALGGTTLTVHATIVLQGGAGAPSPSQQVQDPGLVQQITKIIKDAAAAAGVGVAPA